MSKGDVVEVSASIDLDGGAPSELAFRVAVARDASVDIVEESMLLGGMPLEIIEGFDGGRLSGVSSTGAAVQVRYTARCEVGEAPPPAPLPLAALLHWTAPSRYCPSDATGGFAAATFGTPTAAEAVHDVTAWVRGRTEYLAGSSQATSTAIDTLTSAAGVCRDFAHLTICLLRSLGVPARYVAAYAPGLEPPDFHALVEAHVEGEWQLVDPTGLSDPDHAVRIAVGRDGADVAFLTVLSGDAPLRSMNVSAVLL